MAPQSWLPTQWSMASRGMEGRKAFKGSVLEAGRARKLGRKDPV